MYMPRTFGSASHTAVQSVSQYARTASRLSSAAGAHSLVAVQYTAQHSASHALAAATAVVELSQSVAHKTCRLGQSTSLALFHGANQTSASLKRHLAAAQVALQQAGHASALVLRSLGSDVAEASRSVVRSAPMVMRKVQEDVGHKLEGAQAMVKHAGHSVSHRVTHATHHVSLVNHTLAADFILVDLLQQPWSKCKPVLSFGWITFAGQYSSQSDHAQHADTQCQGQHAKDRLGCQNLAAHHGTIGAAGCSPVAGVHYRCKAGHKVYLQVSPGENRQALYNVLPTICELGCLNHVLYHC